MSEKLIDRLTKDQIEAILDSLPIEFIFVDEKDCLQYYNKGEKRARKAPENILGRDIRQCHKPESLPRTDKMLDDFKNGTSDEDEFWIDGLGIKILNRFLAVRDASGKYVGCLEYLLNYDELDQLAEQKKDSYRFQAASDGEKKVEDKH
ncbi:MAG: hypothetical protein GY866_33885 [Proteobacteria bacterium]|nr:hypothetical protein [Pseudomonadota bacterium]